MKVEETIDTVCAGLVIGQAIGYDPLGTVYHLATEKKTVGGFGIDGTIKKIIKDYTESRQRNIATQSTYFKVSKSIGVVSGLLANIFLSGIPQIVSAGANYHINTK